MAQVRRFAIFKAVDSGFVVLDDSGPRGAESAVVCAGSLDHCLAYLRTAEWPADKWEMMSFSDVVRDALRP